MNYITHTRYKGKNMTGAPVLIRRGKTLERKGNMLCYKDEPVCIHRSLIGKQHFAVDEDGKGMERGTLTHEIAYAPRFRTGGTEERPIQQRFTDEELEILSTRWAQYIKPNCDMLLFNDEFFELPVETLREIAESVHIDVKPYIQEGTECTAS